MKCVFLIENPDAVQDPENVIQRHFGKTPVEYFKEIGNGFWCELDCVPSVGDAIDYNIFPSGVKATLTGVITWKCLCVQDEKSEACYTYYVKAASINDNEKPI